MIRLGFIGIVFLALSACKSKTAATNVSKEEVREKEGPDYNSFSEKFSTVSVPYTLTDTTLLKNKDTATIVNQDIIAAIPDSITNAIFSKEGKRKYVAMGKIVVPKAETYFIVKATQGSKKAALLLTFNKEKKFGAVLPFLVPDDDPATVQSSTIDKNYNILLSVTRKQKDDVNKEGKEVFVYNNDAKQFTLIMTDLLDEKNRELINPIDTLPNKNKFSGDYVKNKNNIVSIRDVTAPNERMIFVHIENEEGDCTGELKGRAVFVSSNMAVYRQGGDPCVLQLSFKPTSVTLKEEEGCGSHRGLNCLFEGTYPIKKEPKPKKETQKHTSKKK